MPIRSRARQRRPSTVRVRATAGLAVVIAALTAALTGPVTATATTAESSISATPSAALTAARALADATPGTSVIGADLADDLGYEPAEDLGLAAKRTGDCSSPVPLPPAFEPACRVHDLGYDLLRVAHRQGAPIPRGLRTDLDSLLARQMRHACDDDVPCVVAAEVASVAVRINTMRQGHGAPVAESLPW